MTTASDRDVATLLAHRAAQDGTTAAFVEGITGATLTWAELQERAEGWTSVAARLGRDRRIGLLVSDPLAMVGAYLAALASGITVAPLNPDGAVPERRRQADALGLAAIVTDDPAADSAGRPRWLLSSSDPAPVEGDVVVGGADPAGHLPVAPSGRAAVILASSGTTGTPKIIPLTEAQLLHTARSLVEHHGLVAGDRGYCPLPLFHINALVVGVLSTVVAGNSLVVDRRFSARAFWPAVERHGATWLNLVPAIIGVLADLEPPAGVADRVAFARSASAPLPGATRERFEQRTGIGVLETYGMTEAASQIAANPRDPSARRPGSVGRPVGIQARVVDPQGEPAPVGEIGQVQIGGASVVEHYWTPCTPAGGAGPDGSGSVASGATSGVVRATSDAGWLDTGDLGRMDADGYLYLVGRVDDVINRGGEKVFPRDVEEVLLRDPDVTAAAVVGRPHPTVGHEPVAFVQLRPGARPAEVSARLARLCTAELSRFRRPASITVTDSLPAGPTGKIRHSQLRRELAAAAGGIS